MEKEHKITQDTILGGRIHLLQPAHGYRVAIDPIFLAASIPAQPSETILDIGTGVGAAALCIAVRLPGVHVVGLEVQREIVRLANKNIDLNNLKGSVEILTGDLTQPPPRLAPSTFSHVMANPPYYNGENGTPSPSNSKQQANFFPKEFDGLKAWITFACLMVRPKGTVTFIYPAERLEEILSLLHGKLGNLTIFPLWPHAEKSAKRVIIRGIKSLQGPTRLIKGMVLHTADGKFSETAEAILRQGSPLVF